jgi:hypothetical protein
VTRDLAGSPDNPSRPRPARFWAVACALAAATSLQGAQDRPGVKRVTWEDVAPLHGRLQEAGVSGDTFAARVQRIHDENARRVRDGDLDHLIFYLLQSTRFTRFAAIEPAVSAKTLVDRLDQRDREAFLRDPATARRRVPEPVRARLKALLRAFDQGPRDARLSYFRRLVDAQFPEPRAREDALLGEYLRVMRFVYQKEFVAQRSADPSTAVADLYRSRGLSTDTAVEAGYVVYLGLGVLRSLDPDRRIRRILLVGPGLDLAPRTALDEEGPPESYQPWAVMDAALSLGLSSAEDLEVVAVDINPRVVEHLRRARGTPPTLTLVSEIEESATVTFSDMYRDYFGRLGRATGTIRAMPPAMADGRLRKTLRVHPDAARALAAERLDIVTERLTGAPFDLVVATNILPYFADTELMLAAANIDAMLAPGGVFLHNESRPALGPITDALGLQFEQSRHAVIAGVRGAAAPLFDSVFLHVAQLKP